MMQLGDWTISDLITALFIFGCPILFITYSAEFFTMKDQLTFRSFFKKFYMRSSNPVENFKLYVFQISFILITLISVAVISVSMFEGQ